MFNVNDTVLYGTEGVCKIIEITEKSFWDKMEEYYVLKPIYGDNSTVFIPMGNEILVSKMHLVLSADEIHEIINEIPDENFIWIDDENIRKFKYKEIIDNGDRRELVKLIKVLYLHQHEQQAKGKNLHVSDERFLKNAEKTLYEEFALVLKIKPEQVLPFILQHIVKEKQ